MKNEKFHHQKAKQREGGSRQQGNPSVFATQKYEYLKKINTFFSSLVLNAADSLMILEQNKKFQWP